ncbi:cyclic nucleotide-gated cation channel alpha-3-like [Dreissena polymorpha]|uniref:cyclic nucleotide-gated cation channel alpha-3-like n=1 Tax=Dreissena polymorpha TaxID=45954 RepID=UPI0022646B96|nr:cyclic nucleotide-gated cation channel alpha-3-like [Dreissena polymorpha]
MRVSFYKDGCLVLDPQIILNRYMNSRKFICDVTSVLPLGTVFGAMNVVCGFLYADLSPVIPYKVQILLVRLPRLLKYSTISRYFDLKDSRTRNPNLLRAFKLSLNLWVVIHWMGCAYYLVSEYEGLGVNSWVYPSGPEYASFTRKYIRVMYWSLMTLTTIGERPPPETDLEFVFTGATFLIGVLVFAAVVGNVGDVITNMNATRTEFQSRMDQIKSYLQHHQVDEKLQNRVKRWADYTWNRTQSIDEPSLLQMLPDHLRTEIAINVHLETLKKVKIFEECEEGLLRELVLKLRPQVYSPGDYICRTSEIGKEMYIVNHGKVEILVANNVTGKRTYLTTLTSGSYFGEISLLKIDEVQNRRTADVRAVGYSELLRLSRRDLMSALVEYPNAKRILEQHAKERIQEIRRPSYNTPSQASGDVFPSTSGSKKDMLFKVIKSENFKKILAARQVEMGEIRSVLNDLRQFDSQSTKQMIADQQSENQELTEQIKYRDKEILLLRNKVSRLKSKDRAFRVIDRNSPKSARRQYDGHAECACDKNSNNNLKRHTRRSEVSKLCRSQSQGRRDEIYETTKDHSKHYQVTKELGRKHISNNTILLPFKADSVNNCFKSPQNFPNGCSHSPIHKTLPSCVNKNCARNAVSTKWQKMTSSRRLLARSISDFHDDSNEFRVIKKLLEIDSCLSDSSGRTSDTSDDEHSDFYHDMHF